MSPAPPGPSCRGTVHAAVSQRPSCVACTVALLSPGFKLGSTKQGRGGRGGGRERSLAVSLSLGGHLRLLRPWPEAAAALKPAVPSPFPGSGNVSLLCFWGVEVGTVLLLLPLSSATASHALPAPHPHLCHEPFAHTPSGHNNFQSSFKSLNTTWGRCYRAALSSPPVLFSLWTYIR